MMDWKEAIRRWRALPWGDKHRRHRENILRSGKRSFAIGGEPVELTMLEAGHARRHTRPLFQHARSKA